MLWQTNTDRSTIIPALKSTRHANSVNSLSQLVLFAGIPEGELELLASRCTAKDVQKDDIVFMQGDPCAHVWIVQYGRVKIVRQDDLGRETIIELIEAGEAFGGGVLFFPNQPATARAAETSLVISLPTADYTTFIATHPQTALKLLRMLGQRHFTMLQMHSLAGERVERRMAHILLKLADRCGKAHEDGIIVALPLSRQDLADMAGTTLETAIRTISRFAHEGIVRTERGGYVLILDHNRLSIVAHEG